MHIAFRVCLLRRKRSSPLVQRPLPRVLSRRARGFFLRNGLEVTSFSTRTRSRVGAGLPAMVVNDNAYELNKRGALEAIAFAADQGKTS
ncbi:hypothetical protein AN403_4739 [Pseudomonas fluorescens]|uniref:Uncharacterized protein n=1 Tax=Pseudomonas fluorescens TaxID=294 RepID=A0A0P8X404_PSEFL|nr:hypothetical protein AN403_4739 [Pseudomonas fluorescens]